MNKEIGILTFHRTTNFGSVLQTYGLFRQIEKMGYNPVIIDYRCPAIEKRENLQRKKDYSSIKSIAKELVFQPVVKKKGEELESFVHQKMKLSKAYNKKTIRETQDCFSKFFVGSDIVWGLDITENDTTYFLDFVSDKSKKFAFSSSVGHRAVSENDMMVKDYLFDFSQIAVREDDGAAWVNDLIGIRPSVVCDPTMLLTIDEWEEAISPSKIIAGKYVLVYFDNDNHKCSRDAYEYAIKRGYKVFCINYGRSRDGIKAIRPTTLNEFLGLIKYAECVFTSSYHGLLFLLYYHKKLVYYTRAHKSRIISLEKVLNIHRCGDESIDFIDEEINYDAIDCNIESFREASKTVLREMLET